MNANDKTTTIEEVRKLTRKLVAERDWDRLHTLKDLGMDISVESSELLELFLWKTEEEIREKLTHDTSYKKHVEEELSDVFISAMLMANKLNLDIATIVKSKIEEIAQKYPVEKCKGKNLKYTEL